jgi:D-aminoacyl-tRNA deacylase
MHSAYTPRTQKREQRHTTIKLYGNLFPLNAAFAFWKAQQMILIAASSKDPAGVNIARQILSHYSFSKTSHVFQENPVYSAEINGKQVRFVTLKEETVNAQTLPDHFPDLSLIVFVSRHSSASGTPTLSVHTPGNFAAAELGGLPRKVSVSPATAMQTALKALKRYQEEMNLDYAVSYECTHHGPSLNVPTMFVELGSSAKQWSDLKAAEAVAHAAMKAIAEFNVSERTAAIGIGGTHYNQHFTQMALADEAVFSHMIPKYAVQQMDAELLSHCVERTLEKVDSAILDWKGIQSKDKPKLLVALREIKLPCTRV